MVFSITRACYTNPTISPSPTGTAHPDIISHTAHQTPLQGYTARWIVDWADHLWIEVLVRGRWVHLDPCEAAVDEPLLYESWGKNQTYIMALTRESIDDVTLTYTTKHAAAMERRETSQDDMDRAISEALLVLRNRTSALQLSNGSRW